MSSSSVGDAVNAWVNKRWWVPVAEGVILAVFGILVLIATGSSSNAEAGALVLLYVFLAIFLIVHGVVTFVGALAEKGSPDRSWGMAFGVISVLLGILAFVFPRASIVAFCWLLIVFVLVAGILAVMRALAWRRIPGASWGWMLAFGILMVLLAVYCLVFPIIGAAAISFALLFWIGFVAILGGIMLIWAGVQVKRLTDRLAAG